MATLSKYLGLDLSKFLSHFISPFAKNANKYMSEIKSSLREVS